MKNNILFIILLFISPLVGVAQELDAFDFKEYKTVPATSVKSQDKTGTCWSYSTASFIESEAIRLGKEPVDLSEMFVARHIYRQKAENYVRRQGSARFSEGGLQHDLLNVVAKEGIVPQGVYPGTNTPGNPYDHSKLESELKLMLDTFIAQGRDNRLDKDWLQKVDNYLDAQFGALPKSFSYNGQLYSPKEYAQYLGFNASDYINITSFTHHPFYTAFQLEVPDNFSNGSYYNIPVNEMMMTINYAIQTGYSVVWDADVSNNGFSAKNGKAIVPAQEWSTKSDAQKAQTFKVWEKEKDISQEYRQELFDKQITQDDHLMHIVGILEEKHGPLFYKVKNSWGEISDLKGFIYASDSYLRLNTISISVHKNAIPLSIKKRLGLAPGEANIEKEKVPSDKIRIKDTQRNGKRTDRMEEKVKPAEYQKKAEKE